MSVVIVRGSLIVVVVVNVTQDNPTINEKQVANPKEKNPNLCIVGNFGLTAETQYLRANC